MQQNPFLNRQKGVQFFTNQILVLGQVPKKSLLEKDKFIA